MSQSEIYIIFGKRGSGKSNLTKSLIEQIGGRVVYISMIDNLKVCDLELYTFEDIDKIGNLKEGQIAICKNYSYEMFSYLCSAMIVNKNFTFAIDEVNAWQGHESLEKLIDYSRHHEINLIANTRRYTDCPRKLTSEGKIFIFKTTEPRDKDYIFQTIGEKIDIENLDTYQYYDVDLKEKKYSVLSKL